MIQSRVNKSLQIIYISTLQNCSRSERCKLTQSVMPTVHASVETKYRKKGVPHYFDITTLTTRPSLFFSFFPPKITSFFFKWHSTPTSCKILKASCYREQSPAPVLTAPSQKEFVRNKYCFVVLLHLNAVKIGPLQC